MRSLLGALVCALAVAGCASAPLPLPAVLDPSNPEAPLPAPVTLATFLGGDATSPPPAPAPAPAPTAEGKYTCPMHPEVHSDAPGRCPKCGMKLVEKKPATSSEEAPQ